MLPGFRFLLAAIVLSSSILVFGLGAAALLRAAHEEFISTPSWRAIPEPLLAQQSEPAKPVLAVLSAEPPGETPGETEAAGKNRVKAAAQATIQVEVVPEGDPGPPAAALPEPAKSANAGLPNALQSEAAPTSTAPPVASEFEPSGLSISGTSETEISKSEIKITATDPTPNSAREAAGIQEPSSSPAAIEQADASATIETAHVAADTINGPAQDPSAAAKAMTALPDHDAIAAKLATLGGPAVTGEPPTNEPPSPPAKTDGDSARLRRIAILRRQQARWAAERRRIAQRARATAPEPALAFPPQQTADPSRIGGG
jgi:hypothetical protein